MAAARWWHVPPARRAARESDVDRRTTKRQKTGVFTGALRHQPSQRPGRADLDRRLRADGLRHRGDHGRAVRRPARLRVRRCLRPRHAADPATAGRVVRRAAASSPTSTRPRGPRRSSATPRTSTRRTAMLDLDGIDRVADGIAATNAWLEANGYGAAPSPTSCATGCSAASATGASRSRSSTTQTGCGTPLPDDMLPLELPETDGYSPRTFDPDDEFSEPGEPARPAGRLGRTSSSTSATARSGTAATPT